MEKAIVTGATGYIGSAVVRELLHRDIEVLALGRSPWQDVDPKRLPKSNKLKYILIDASDIFNLPNKIKEIGWEPGNSCVFYNFTWAGRNRLTDGTIEDQLKNVTYSANTIVVAKRLGCIKFINAGTLEETFVENYLKLDWKNNCYHSNHDIYAISKLAARDMCRLVAYLQKIDYIHTRFSTFVTDDLNATGYIHAVLNKIANNEAYDAPMNNQLFDFLPLEEGVKAFYLIGKKGKNKADYFIGSGEPTTLSHYFDKFKAAITNIEYPAVENIFSKTQILKIKDFSIKNLNNDTGFSPSVTFDNYIKKRLKQ